MLKVGLIGCGGMGKVHADCWAALKDRVEFVAIADTVAENAQKYVDMLGVKVYATGDELLANEELDIIDICTPTFLHTQYAVAAMKKGCNVFIEKPICLNEEEAQLLLKTQEETGAKVQVGQVVRFFDEYKWLKDLVDSGKYGKVVSAVFERLSPNPAWSWQNWYNDPEKSGTAALDLHVHDVDFVRYMMNGEPDSVSSKATRDKDGVLMQIFSTYTYGDSVVTTEGGWDFPSSFPFTPTYRVKLEKATCVKDPSLKNPVVYVDNGEKFEAEIVPANDYEGESGINVTSLGGYFTEIKYFLDNVITGKGPEIAPLIEAVKSVRLAWEEIRLSGGRKI